jgi:hypothetical protein
LLRLSKASNDGRAPVGIHRREGATALLGLDGFVAGVQLEVDGEWWLVGGDHADVMGCEGCGIRAVSHGRRELHQDFDAVVVALVHRQDAKAGHAEQRACTFIFHPGEPPRVR